MTEEGEREAQVHQVGEVAGRTWGRSHSSAQHHDPSENTASWGCPQAQDPTRMEGLDLKWNLGFWAARPAGAGVWRFGLPSVCSHQNANGLKTIGVKPCCRCKMLPLKALTMLLGHALAVSATAPVSISKENRCTAEFSGILPFEIAP